MSLDNKPRRFPRKAILRQLDRLIEVAAEHRSFYGSRAYDQTLTPAMRRKAVYREEFCDDMYHDLERVSRALYYWT